MVRHSLRLDTVEAVTFDVWGTLLVDADPAATFSTCVRLAARHGRDEALARAALDTAWRRHYTSWNEGRASGVFELADETLRLLGTRNERASADLAAAFASETLEAEIHAVEGARETLRFLCDRGLRLGLVCDTGFATGAVVRQLLDREGLGEWLEVQIYSDEWGVPKPHPRVFYAAIARLDVSAERAVHVGDLLRTDVAGAREVGMGTIRITAAYDDPAHLPEADLVVPSHAALRSAFDAVPAVPRRAASVAALVPAPLPEDEDRLDRRIREGRLRKSQAEAVGVQLAERHRAARCDEETSFQGTVEKLSTEIHSLSDALRGDHEQPTWLQAVEEFLTGFVLRQGDRLHARVTAGRVLTVHGHLAASRVSVSDDGARVRLSDPFRSPLGPAYGDAARDLVDLYDELRAAGLRDHADRFAAAYAEAALDFRLYGVLEFHRRLQALRRRVWYGAIASKAETGATRERGAEEASTAERELAAPPEEREGPLLVVATGGWVGTGKSTVSRAAARSLGAPRLEVDRVSVGLIDDPPVEPVRAEGDWEHEADWERLFAPGFTDAAYAELFRQARRVIESGRSAVLDGCFARQRLRAAARAMAEECGARFVFLECRLKRDIHRQRIADRERSHGAEPDSWAELATRSVRQWEPTTDLDGVDHHRIDTSLDPTQTRARVAGIMAGLLGRRESLDRPAAG